ncbi:MAG: DpnI domain-containing protein, partial [Devosia sp.]|nr:DpnI domain-containing protein [Devosia sp.]
SGTQRARILTERWVADWVYCPNCGNREVTQFTANLPVADFFCPSCNDQYELKSQKTTFGARVVDGAFKTMSQRLLSSDNPNLLLLNYDQAGATVKNLCVVPKHFFVPEIIEQRKPLALTARRAGWVGCNILLGLIPEAGKIFVVRNGVPEPKEAVLAKWQRTLFLRHEDIEARGWLIEVMKCVEMIGRREFAIDDVYAFEARLAALYPNNRNVKPKIRQQLQVLRDSGYLEFVSRGRYRLSSLT